MAARHYPVLTWTDAAGHRSACWIEDPDNRVALGATAAEAIDRLREYLVWRQEQELDDATAEFKDPQLLTLRVEVVPEYHVRESIYPLDEEMVVPVPCVRGRREGGMWVCCAPTFGLRFNFAEAESFKPLVAHYVQGQLRGMTPRELCSHLPPRDVELSNITIAGSRAISRTDGDGGARCPTLALVADALNSKSRQRRFGRSWERETEIAALQRRIGSETASLVLIGEPGCGKTTVLTEAARRIEAGDERSRKDPPRFWQTGASRIIAGMKYVGQWQERCETIIGELAGVRGVLCVENMLELVRVGGHGPEDSIAAFMLPYMQRGELRLIVEASREELEACRRLFPSFAAEFGALAIPAFSSEQAATVLDKLSGVLEQNFKVAPEDGLSRAVCRMFRRFHPHHAFPGRVVPFAMDLFESAKAARRTQVTVQDAIERFTRQTGLPELILRDDLPLIRGDVEAALGRRVIGQEAACAAATDFLLAFKAGLNDPARPLAVLLFTGPTGVGKTELAKSISQFLFGHGEQADRMIRLDMSEYSGPLSASRLLSKPGSEPSDLIQRIRQQPLSVLLLDEIEKANTDVFDVLLGVFDEGRLTDAFGRVTMFTGTVIIMTSNLGSDRQEPFGFKEGAASTFDSQVRAFFRPEFYNRLYATIAFKPLDPPAIERITRKELAEIAAREGLVQANLKLTWTDEVVEMLSRRGFDRRYGARPLQRTLEEKVVLEVSRYLLGNPGLRDSVLELHLGSGDAIAIRRRPA